MSIGIYLGMNLGMGSGGITGTKTIVLDTFNRSNSATTLGNTDTGQIWNVLRGMWGIQNNTAYLVTVVDGTDTAVIQSGVSDCKVTMKIGLVMATGGQVMRLVARCSNLSNMLAVVITTTSFILYRKVADVFTSIGTYAAAPLTGDTVTLDLSGSTIKMLVNGVERINVTETFNQTATSHGISTNSLEPRFDDFKVEAL